MKPLKIVLVVLAVILLGGGAYALTPTSYEEYSDDVSLEHRSQNADLAAALFSGGIEDAFVDVDGERVYVAYVLPEEFDADTVQRFVIGAAADTAPDVVKIVVAQYVDDAVKSIWTVQMSDFITYVNGETTQEEFEAKAEKQDF